MATRYPLAGPKNMHCAALSQIAFRDHHGLLFTVAVTKASYSPTAHNLLSCLQAQGTRIRKP